jgi:sigma-B regulation protein RsbU (phosphoserine phosphatase)
MRIMIAEDDPVSRTLLKQALLGWGHELVETCDGQEAWCVLNRPDSPSLAILDWMMPSLDGPEICRRVRALDRPVATYLILLTARRMKEDIVAALDSGADDYLTKPFDHQELASRIRVGERVLRLQQGLADRVLELEDALAQVKQLKGLLPICSYCKNIRNDKNYWERVDHYLTEHAEINFTHGICPNCWDKVVAPELTAAGIQAPDYPQTK